MKKVLTLLLSLALCIGLAAAAQADFAPVPKDEIKVGVIYIGDVSDKGYTYAHHQGTLYMQQQLGLRDDQIIIKTNISEDASCEAAIRECIEQGANIIFGTSFGFMDYMEELAAEYPNVIFSHCSGYKSNDTNFNNYFGRIYQARFLTGLAAGLKTKTNKIGYVAAFKLPEVDGGLDAYALGIKTVNPDAQILVKYTNTWYDPTLERQAAEALLDAGCDVIGQHQDTAMPQIAAQDRGVWSTGYNADMTEDAPKAHLTAPIWHWGVYVTAAVQQVIDGTWKPENSFMGMAEGLVDISPLSENAAPGTAEVVTEYRAKILAGEFDVFEGEIKDNEGNVVVPAGTKLDVAAITSIAWLLDNVTVD
ncbi:MAG: BMP family ABC transporter substrate-binding protein [Oscillospiraceae bacterium]|jgi:basic membrane protein A|nr:BMP family ABC transporter substrate-binding protein [Oscillospiraceae bacterium]